LSDTRTVQPCQFASAEKAQFCAIHGTAFRYFSNDSDWLAVHPVSRELVSASNSLIDREFRGKYYAAGVNLRHLSASFPLGERSLSRKR
jgi:hypothetical protein